MGELGELLAFVEHLPWARLCAKCIARLSPSALASGHPAMPDLQGRELGFREVDSLAYAHTACEGEAAWLLHLSLDTLPTCLPNLSLGHSPELPTVAQKPLGGGKDRVNLPGNNAYLGVSACFLGPSFLG